MSYQVIPTPTNTRRGGGPTCDHEPRSTLLAFNTVERLLRGDFFHCVTETDIRADLGRFPSSWPIAGLGTTNWYGRNGELLIEGSASAARFYWADPLTDPPGTTMNLASQETAALAKTLTSPSVRDVAVRPHFPFAAVAAWDPAGLVHRWHLYDGEDLHSGIARLCEATNVGLAALRITGRLHVTTYQTMCHIPIGGITIDRPAAARVSSRSEVHWNLSGFYSANPTIRVMLAGAAEVVHLHGRDETSRQGGHLNTATASSETEVEARPLRDLIVRIPDLEVARLPVLPPGVQRPIAHRSSEGDAD
jgi:hypothetical protein